MTDQESDTLTKDSVISFQEITKETLRPILDLNVSENQTEFVAPNSVSIAEAHFEPDHAWFRAVYVDETPVGFVMMYDDPEAPKYYLWRFMIDSRYQGLSYGRRDITLLVEHVRTRPQGQAHWPLPARQC